MLAGAQREERVGGASTGATGYLYRARLLHAVKPYPWAEDADGNVRGPKDDLAAARKLIEQCGYWRRKEELEDAEAATTNW